MNVGFRVTLFALAAVIVLSATPAVALTVRSKSDLRLWETVMDRSRPLSWSWTEGADAASLVFSNRLTHAVSFVSIGRETAATRGSCPHPVASAAGEALVVATLVQTAGGVELSRETAELAYVPGIGTPCAAGGGVSAQPIVVRSKADRGWRRVTSPRLAAFDAHWWNVTGPSGYEALWKAPPGSYGIERAFEGVGIVDEVVLNFGTPGLRLLLR